MTTPSNNTPADRSTWTGKDFEFLIRGDIEISLEEFDKLMTPNSFICNKIVRDEWPYYQIDSDEFSYSWELPGIQMCFNDSITFQKAKKIAEEVLNNIVSCGQSAELIVVDKSIIQRYDD